MELKINSFDNIDDFVVFLKENFEKDDLVDMVESGFQVNLDNALQDEEYEVAAFYRDLINAVVKIIEE